MALHIQTLMLTDVQTDFLGTSLVPLYIWFVCETLYTLCGIHILGSLLRSSATGEAAVRAGVEEGRAAAAAAAQAEGQSQYPIGQNGLFFDLARILTNSQDSD